MAARDIASSNGSRKMQASLTKRGKIAKKRLPHMKPSERPIEQSPVNSARLSSGIQISSSGQDSARIPSIVVPVVDKMSKAR